MKWQYLFRHISKCCSLLWIFYHPVFFQVTSFLVFPIVSSAFSLLVFFFLFNAFELDTIIKKSCFEITYCFKLNSYACHGYVDESVFLTSFSPFSNHFRLTALCLWCPQYFPFKLSIGLGLLRLERKIRWAITKRLYHLFGGFVLSSWNS